MHLSFGILVFNYVNAHSMTRTLTAFGGADKQKPKINGQQNTLPKKS